MIKNFILHVSGSLTLAMLALVTLAPSAQAGAITSQSTTLTVSGSVTLVYIGSDAADSSSLSLKGGQSNIFCNHCSTTGVGQTAFLGDMNGPLDFQLHDNTTSHIFDSASAASDGKFYANIQSTYADLGIGSIPDDALNTIEAYSSSYFSTVTYVGFEDRAGGDYDYNDFVFAVISTTQGSEGSGSIIMTSHDPVALIDPNAPVTNSFSLRSFAVAAPVPEPASLTLFGAGLLGFAARRRHHA